MTRALTRILKTTPRDMWTSVWSTYAHTSTFGDRSFAAARRSAYMEWAAVQSTWHWAIADYFQWTFEYLLILNRVLRPQRICDIYDFFAPHINVLTYLLTYSHTHRFNGHFPGKSNLPLDSCSPTIPALSILTGQAKLSTSVLRYLRQSLSAFAACSEMR